jgi:hypothetical protein
VFGYVHVESILSPIKVDQNMPSTWLILMISFSYNAILNV